MAKAKGTTLRFIYGIFLSLFSVFVGVLFIMQTWSIYRSAPQSPYTVESITAHFNQIALAVWLWVAAIVGNILLAIAFPEREKRPKAYIDMTYALSKTRNNLSLNVELLEKTSSKGKKEKAFRITVGVVCGFVMLAAAAVGALTLFGLFYIPLFQTEFFASHNGVADKLVQCVLLSVLALTVACIAAGLNLSSRKRERIYYLQIKAQALQEKKAEKKEGSRFSSVIDSVVGAIFLGKKKTGKDLDKEVQKALAKPQSTPQKQTPEKPKKTSQKGKTVGVWSLRAAIFAVAVFLLIVGVQNGGMREVFLKAINICTQCIGLG